MMFKYVCLNNISEEGLKCFESDFSKVDSLEKADCVILRSAQMHNMDIPNNIKCIARAGTGVNNIPIDECSNKGIVVFNTPGANSNSVKESVLAGMLMVSRNLIGGIAWVYRNSEKKDIKELAESEKKQFAGRDLAGKTLGVIGLGSIGIKVANAAIELGMKVYGHDAYLSVNSAWQLDHRVNLIKNIDELFKASDYITIHVPYVESTKNMIGESTIDKMKDKSTLLNFSRDKLVDEKSVIKALDRGKLSFYVSDFPNTTVAGHKKCIVTPHLGASTKESEDHCAVMAAENIVEFMNEGNILHSVNFPAINSGKCTNKGRVLILHKNVPNMLNKFGDAIGSCSYNIENMVNNSKGEYAASLIDTSKSFNNKVIKKIQEIQDVLSVRKIK